MSTNEESSSPRYSNPEHLVYICSTCGYKTKLGENPLLVHNDKFPSDPLAMTTACPRCQNQKMFPEPPATVPHWKPWQAVPPERKESETLHHYIQRCYPEIMEEWRESRRMISA